MLLPGITLGWFAVAGLVRLTRSSMLEVLGSEHGKLVPIKGLPERQVIDIARSGHESIPAHGRA